MSEKTLREVRNMEKVRIITDSASDIGSFRKENLTVLPMTIRFGEAEYLDGVTIGHREFYEKLIESEELPHTSLISPQDFEAAFQKAVAAGEKAVVVTLSGKLSGTFQSAAIAAADFPGDVFVVDSRNAAIGEQVLVRYALELAEEGKSAEEIAATLTREREHIHLIALLDTLEYLKKGGRISKSVAFVGGMLAIKPVVTVKDGEVVMLGTARGSKKGNNFLIKEIEGTSGIDFSRPICLGYTGLNDTLLRKYMQDSAFLWEPHTDSLNVCTIGATIGTHVGPNAIAAAFFCK